MYKSDLGWYSDFRKVYVPTVKIVVLDVTPYRDFFGELGCCPITLKVEDDRVKSLVSYPCDDPCTHTVRDTQPLLPPHPRRPGRKEILLPVGRTPREGETPLLTPPAVVVYTRDGPGSEEPKRFLVSTPMSVTVGPFAVEEVQEWGVVT